MKYTIHVVALAALLSGCATAPKDFYEDPTKPKDTPLCRAFLETTDPTFKRDTAAELDRRGLTLEQCQNMVAMETAAVVGIAAVATGVAVVAACQNGCGAPNYTTSAYSADYDCAGGGGDGPYYKAGPFRLIGKDYYDLDRDNDGIACEPYDDRGS